MQQNKMSRKNIRIVVVGDENVGKSWLIHTIYSQVSSNIEKTLKKVILPPEMCLYSRQVFTELVDTSVDMDITPEIRVSDLVLLVYDVSDPDTIDRIQGEWLPRIAAINAKLQQIPVILVGNKMDKKQLEYQAEHEYIKIKDILKKVTKRYKNVQMGIECSAFYDRNVKSVLNCAQRAVLYPLSPLYNLEQRKITTNFRKALTRIFRILDQDFDGRLRDSQLTALQERVFQSQLNIQDIKAIKEVILRELEVEQSDYIELKGFIALQKKVIEMLKIQICWSILRYFNYNDQLRIKINTEHFVLEEKQGESVELSSQAINFLIKMYTICRKTTLAVENKEQNRDSMMMEQSTIQNRLNQSIFYPCPEISFAEFDQQATVASQQRFLTTWSLYAFINYKKCYEDLLYLGYEQSLDEAFSRRKSKKSYGDFMKMRDNKVFSVLIVESGLYQGYIDPLFLDAKKISYAGKDNREVLSYWRTSKLFTNQNIAKTFLLFKVKKHDLPSFLYQNSETSFARRVDLIIEFDDSSYNDLETDVRNLAPDFVLHRKISKREAEQLLHANSPPKLDLTSIPVRYDEKAYLPFFNDIVYKTLQNIEDGLSKKKVQELKQESKHKKNMYIISTVSVAITLIIIGSVVLPRYNIRLWK